MSTGAWSAAWKARTLKEAHEALVVLRPLPEAARSVWVTYYRRSSEVYRHVAEVDDGHQVHANYWADREKAKADQLAGSADRSSAGTSGARRKRRSNASVAVDAVPSTLEAVHDWLSKARPTGDAAKAVWLAYHEHAAAAYAEVAEVDRAHHHETLFYAGLERRRAAALSARTEAGAEKESLVDSACQ